MSEKRPMLITFIGDLNVLNIFLIIVSFFPKFIERFGIYSFTISTFSGDIIKLLVIIILLITTYGFFKLKRWGYWLMITYNIFFIVLSIIVMLKQNGQSYSAPSIITSALGLIITLPSKRYFTKKLSPKESTQINRHI